MMKKPSHQLYYAFDVCPAEKLGKYFYWDIIHTALIFKLKKLLKLATIPILIGWTGFIKTL